MSPKIKGECAPSRRAETHIAALRVLHFRSRAKTRGITTCQRGRPIWKSTGSTMRGKSPAGTSFIALCSTSLACFISRCEFFRCSSLFQLHLEDGCHVDSIFLSIFRRGVESRGASHPCAWFWLVRFLACASTSYYVPLYIYLYVFYIIADCTHI